MDQSGTVNVIYIVFHHNSHVICHQYFGGYCKPMICTGVCEFIKTKHGQGYSHRKCGKFGELCYFCYVPNFAVRLELSKLFSAKSISMPIHHTLVPPIFIIYGICICGGRELKGILM